MIMNGAFLATVASIQLNSSADIDDNLARIERLLADAKKQGAELALLPENCVYMGKVQGDTKDIAEPLAKHSGQGRVQQAFAEMAKRHGLWVLVGAFATTEDESVYQTLLVYNDNGERVAHYHKRHLFNVTLPDGKESYRESDAFSAGDRYRVVDTPVGKIGLAICYDLRFPEQFRALLDLGAEIFVLPAAFTYRTGEAHWETLLRARAIENQCYVIASGQCGRHASGRQTWGHSMIINSWGEILAQQAEGEGVVVADIDKELLHHQRQIFPVLTHRLS